MDSGYHQPDQGVTNSLECLEGKREVPFQISHDVIYMWNLKKKKDTKELIYKTEIESQTWKTNMVIKGDGTCVGRRY